MTKEQTLELLKDCILTLRDRSEQLDPRHKSFNPNLTKAWQKQATAIQESVKSMNSCDADWLGEQYTKWWKESGLEETGLKIKNNLLDI